jgi:hypothetical protein
MTEPAPWQTTDYYRSLPRWKQVVLEHADLFILRYFPHRIDELQDFHYDLINTALDEIRGLVLYPAGHGKTTLVSTIIPILRLCRDPNWREAIIAKNDTEAEGIMAVIQTELVDNELLVRDFGPFKPTDNAKPWALGRLMVEKRTRRAKEATIAVFGAGAKTVLGYRTDHTTCDDVVTGENSATPTQREKTRNWFDLSVETGPEHEDSGLTVVGTRFDPADLYGDLKEMIDPETGEAIWHVDEVDAVVDEETEDHALAGPLVVGAADGDEGEAGDAELQQAVPQHRRRLVTDGREGGVHPRRLGQGRPVSRLPRQGLQDRRVRARPVACGRRLRPRRRQDQTREVLRPRDHRRRLLPRPRALLLGARPLPQPVDVAAAGRPDPRRARAVRARLHTGGGERVPDRVERGRRAEDERERARVPCRAALHVTDEQARPETGVSAMSPWFEQGKFHIPWGDPHSQRVMAQLVDELVTFPGRTTDTVMSVWFAWRYLERSAPKFQSFNRLDRQTGSRPWLPKSRRGMIRNPAYPAREREAV